MYMYVKNIYIFVYLFKYTRIHAARTYILADGREGPTTHTTNRIQNGRPRPVAAAVPLARRPRSGARRILTWLEWNVWRAANIANKNSKAVDLSAQNPKACFS